MTANETEVLHTELPFAGFPTSEDLLKVAADVAILGIPYVTPSPYSPVPTSPTVSNALLESFGDTSLGAESIRKMSQRLGSLIAHYDFDLEGDLFGGRDLRVVDCGNVDLTSPDEVQNRKRAERAVRQLLERGAIPLILGGDHATTIPILKAYEGRGPICVVQIDAHLDFRDEVGGAREGYSSPMRRASEMPWVQSIAQVGMRGMGSARTREVDEARAYGSIIVRAEELHRFGVEDLLRKIPRSENYYITLDADGLDPAIAPGVDAPAPGGVTYYQMVGLMRGLAQMGHIVGADFVEFAPDLDLNGRTGFLLARLIVVLLGCIARQRSPDSR
jgi:agmatinase